MLKKGTAGRQPEAYFTYRNWESWDRKLKVLKKGTAGAATGNCRCLKREHLADSLRPTLHIGNGGGESWDRKLQVLKKGTAGAATGNCRCLKREQLVQLQETAGA
jgi:hypothetical protein